MPRMLMVDDAALFRMLEWSFLRRSGWEIERARDDAEVMQKARAHAPDLVVLDTRPQAMDAPSCLDAMRADPRLRAVPVVVLAAPELTARCAEAGADRTLSHPVEPAALVSALCALGRVDSRREARRRARLPVRVTSPEGPLRGWLKDLSRTGAFVSVPRPIAIDAAVEIALSLPCAAGTQAFRAQGIVMRQVAERPGSHLIAGCGLRFTTVHAAGIPALEEFVGQDRPVDATPGNGGGIA